MLQGKQTTKMDEELTENQKGTEVVWNSRLNFFSKVMLKEGTTDVARLT